jgi:hypothetical protein
VAGAFQVGQERICLGLRATPSTVEPCTDFRHRDALVAAAPLALAKVAAVSIFEQAIFECLDGTRWQDSREFREHRLTAEFVDSRHLEDILLRDVGHLRQEVTTHMIVTLARPVGAMLHRPLPRAEFALKFSSARPNRAGVPDPPTCRRGSGKSVTVPSSTTRGAVRRHQAKGLEPGCSRTHSAPSSL